MPAEEVHELFPPEYRAKLSTISSPIPLRKSNL
jgi:hypothetical protein